MKKFIPVLIVAALSLVQTPVPASAARPDKKPKTENTEKKDTTSRKKVSKYEKQTSGEYSAHTKAGRTAPSDAV